MNESGEEGTVIESKVAGLRTFADAGFRTFAVVDNEPAVIAALAEADESGEILFLQAQTFSESRRGAAPPPPRGPPLRPTPPPPQGDPPPPPPPPWAGGHDATNPRPLPRAPVPLARGHA